MGKSSRAIGLAGEQLACDFLVQKGYKMIEQNYRIKGGEIDIIAKISNELVFVEVKARSSNRYGYPEESVSKTKLMRVCKAIKDYIANNRLYNATYRFDIISIMLGPTQFDPFCHPRGGGDPESDLSKTSWIPVFTGMTAQKAQMRKSYMHQGGGIPYILHIENIELPFMVS